VFIPPESWYPVCYVGNMAIDRSLFVNLIQANLEELSSLRLILSPEGPLGFYAEILFAYLKGDIQALGQLVSISETNPKEEPYLLINVIARMRLNTRRRILDTELISTLLNRIHALSDDLWKGEVYFVLAYAYETAEQHESAKSYYKLAAAFLGSQGANRKAAKAEFNYVAADSCIQPDKKRLIADYYFAFKKCRRVREYGMAGAALNNISREYFRLGAHKIALNFSKRALKLLERDFGTIHYYLAVLHQAHVLMALERRSEALLLMEHARGSEFPEIRAGLAVLDGTISNGTGGELERDLIPTWAERLKKQKGRAPQKILGSLESQLIELLLDGPKHKFEIMDNVYGTRLSMETRESRFKMLMSRLRKKHPGLICLDQGKYRLLDEDASVLTKRSA